MDTNEWASSCDLNLKQIGIPFFLEISAVQSPRIEMKHKSSMVQIWSHYWQFFFVRQFHEQRKYTMIDVFVKNCKMSLIYLHCAFPCMQQTRQVLWCGTRWLVLSLDILLACRSWHKILLQNIWNTKENKFHQSKFCVILSLPWS